MKQNIHPTAIVDSAAKIGKGVEIGAYAMVGPDCEIGEGCIISPRATLEKNVILAPRVKVGVGSVLGGDPQDLKFEGENTTVEVGEDTVIREYTTINRGTSHSWKTKVGKKCFIMSYVHLAHDCILGDNVIMANGAQLAGHVVVGDRVGISGLVAVHQFVRIGKHAYIGGCSRVSKDIPPFMKAVGNPIQLYGLNSVGLQRSGFSEDTMRELKRAYRLFFRSDMNVTQAIAAARQEVELIPEVEELLHFMEGSERGVVV